jgi:hypothetical protein
VTGVTLPFDGDRTAVGPAEDEERNGVVGGQWFSSGVQGGWARCWVEYWPEPRKYCP